MAREELDDPEKDEDRLVIDDGDQDQDEGINRLRSRPNGMNHNNNNNNNNSDGDGDGDGDEGIGGMTRIKLSDRSNVRFSLPSAMAASPPSAPASKQSDLS